MEQWGLSLVYILPTEPRIWTPLNPFDTNSCVAGILPAIRRRDALDARLSFIWIAAKRSIGDIHHKDIGLRVQFPSKDVEMTAVAGINEHIQFITFEYL